MVEGERSIDVRIEKERIYEGKGTNSSNHLKNIEPEKKVGGSIDVMIENEKK